MIKITRGSDKKADQRIYVRVDREAYARIRSKHPDIQIAKYLREYLLRLDDDAPVVPTVEPEGIKIKCHRCGHSWLYTGQRAIIKCNRCNGKLRTHLYTKA